MCKLFFAPLLVVITVLSGCAGNMKLYADSTKSDADISVLRGTEVTRGPLGWKYSTILITAVDGTHVQAPNMKPNTVNLLPGRHVVLIGAFNPRSQCYTQFTADLAAGHLYEVRFIEAADADGDRPIAIQQAWLQDVTTGKIVLAIGNWAPTQKADWNLPAIIHAR